MDATDWWARDDLRYEAAADHAMPPLAEDDRIALIDAGYGSAMSSNHCMRGEFTEL